MAKWTPQAYSLGDLAATAFKLDIAATLRIGFVEIIFVFLFIDLFDNIGTLVAVGKKANLFNKAHQIPRLNRILLSRRDRHHRRFAHRDLDGGELYRERGRSGGGRTDRRDRDRHRDAVHRGAIRGAGGGRDSRLPRPHRR